VAAEALADLPLLQQSTRPYGWRQWFDAMGVDAPHALDGPRYELFSMLAVAATHGMGVALIPPLLIEAELASGELVVACPAAARRACLLPHQPRAGPAPGAGRVFAHRAWLQRPATAAL
jgi:DNA-binding transcriptional LysR family regulator